MILGHPMSDVVLLSEVEGMVPEHPVPGCLGCERSIQAVVSVRAGVLVGLELSIFSATEEQ